VTHIYRYTYIYTEATARFFLALGGTAFFLLLPAVVVFETVAFPFFGEVFRFSLFAEIVIILQ